MLGNTYRRLPTRKVPIWALALFAGAVLSAYSNESVGALIVIPVLGAIIAAGIGRALGRSSHEIEIFLLSYGILALAAGIAQTYSFHLNQYPLMTVDAFKFFEAATTSINYSWNELNTLSIDDVSHVGLGSALNVVVWRRFYEFTSLLGFGQAPYIGVILNSAMIALSGVLTHLIAKEIFGNEHKLFVRLRFLYATSGSLWLVGSLFLSDALGLLLNVLALWAIVFLMRRLTWQRLIPSAVLIVACIFAIKFVRDFSELPIVAFVIIASLIYMIRFINWSNKTVPIVGFLVMIAIATLFFTITDVDQKIAFIYAAQQDVSEATNAEDSLGMSLVLNQPIPVRAILGSGTIILYPIPLWTLLTNSGPYFLILSWQGIYSLLLTPLWAVGGYLAIRGALKRMNEHGPLLLLLIVSAMMLLAVAVTSLQVRHYIQYYPAAIILAASVDPTNLKHRRLLKLSIASWLLIVMVVHIGWGLVKLL